MCGAGVCLCLVPSNGPRPLFAGKDRRVGRAGEAINKLGMLIALVRVMAAQLTLPRIPRVTARLPIRTFQAPRSLALRRRAWTCCKVGAIAAFVISLPLALLVYSSYSTFAQLIDQQIAEGYLRSHAGLYAAPRVI